MRYLFEVAYFGENYSGWQRQPNATGIQEKLEDAISTILRKKHKIVGSGRTDTGVHAIQQFFHIDLKKEPENLDVKLNAFLPQDIAIKSIREIKSDAHARFSAESRSYEYWVNQHKDPFSTGRSYYFSKELNVDRMNEAASAMIGERNFKTFSKVKTDVKIYVCDLKAAFWHEEKNHLIFYVTANRFLRGMVRAMVGTLLLLGEEKLSVAEFEEILKTKNRKKAGQNVPAQGLYLTKVQYPEDIFI